MARLAAVALKALDSAGGTVEVGGTLGLAADAVGARLALAFEQVVGVWNTYAAIETRVCVALVDFVAGWATEAFWTAAD